MWGRGGLLLLLPRRTTPAGCRQTATASCPALQVFLQQALAVVVLAAEGSPVDDDLLATLLLRALEVALAAAEQHRSLQCMVSVLQPLAATAAPCAP